MYVMAADGGNPQNLTNNRHGDGSPAWFGPAFAVSPASRTFTIWGRVKRLEQ